MGDFTPLDYESLSSAAQPDSKKVPFFKHLPNILLIAAFVAFTLSLTYSVQTYQVSLNSQASVQPTPIVLVASPSPTPATKKFMLNSLPVKYKDTAVDDACSTSMTANPQEALDLIAKYYVFKDILAENKITVTASKKSGCDKMQEELLSMEELVQKQLLSIADFAYVKAKFKDVYLASTANDTDTPQSKARSVVADYKKKFEASGFYQDVVTASNSDTLLKQLNGFDKNQVLQNYTAESKLFTDPNFNTFLFAQKETVPSNIFILKDQDGIDEAYIVVYPIKINARKYSSFDDILVDKNSNFIYQ